jgi:hypothetical protein
MAHYAILDENNIVIKVITGTDENELIEGVTPEIWYTNFTKMKCVRTSYNNRIRKQYAGIGYTYDATSDVFIARKPYPSWLLNESHDWQAPTDYPADGKVYLWDETNLTWILRN